MAIVEQTRFETEKARDHDASIMLGYLLLSVIFLFTLYAASMAPGTATGAVTSMTAFP
jgi:hypothetical protein